jgi:hypothetical protein
MHKTAQAKLANRSRATQLDELCVPKSVAP